LLEFEQARWAEGDTAIAGVDEAGRGPLAGPVVAAAVCFDRGYIDAACAGVYAGLTDSKKLTERQRSAFFAQLTEDSRLRIGVGQAEPREIDRINILAATHASMGRAVAALTPPPDHVLVDGLPVKGLSGPSTAIVKGDQKSFSIAAASVIAKVTRDRIMLAYDAEYPVYGFAHHKGYPTPVHLAALREHGPCEIHRFSFRPVAECQTLL